ncbi:MAG: 4-hydroxy-3-methylbut-2-enyl diphosphate reductase, partial [Acidobacteria bacterium]|nr:4-hydroxy-3-methylbut-2-enyl diphosphate reductase [Acidobacteriota bacterium]
TAGASAPELVVENVVRYLKSCGYTSVREVTVTQENVFFSLPPELHAEAAPKLSSV